MTNEKPERCRMSRMSRTVMIMAGRKGKRQINRDYFVRHRERILTAWSRTNLEGRSATWCPRNILPSMFVRGDMAMLLTVEKSWSNALQALREGVVWRN